eukprot:CAMPEP_0174273622 /NCGR_PEP_ID=MMETSP0439-20130205/55199_1 /TAXON_ID=0 /ORGANISM="Stereomyxa ramosa, Strain Chinc5" /LENGTH=206 /DNA_ID=CAMNT_0015364901 /DNA_START=434 /DNA_END=1052 /DNA_ORIENTATION=-
MKALQRFCATLMRKAEITRLGSKLAFAMSNKPDDQEAGEDDSVGNSQELLPLKMYRCWKQIDFNLIDTLSIAFSQKYGNPATIPASVKEEFGHLFQQLAPLNSWAEWVHSNIVPLVVGSNRVSESHQFVLKWAFFTSELTKQLSQIAQEPAVMGTFHLLFSWMESILNHYKEERQEQIIEHGVCPLVPWLEKFALPASTLYGGSDF